MEVAIGIHCELSGFQVGMCLYESWSADATLLYPVFVLPGDKEGPSRRKKFGSDFLIGRGEGFYLIPKCARVRVCLCVLTSPKANFLPLSILLQGISL